MMKTPETGTSMKNVDLEKLCKSLGYTFRQPLLLCQAFQHASFVNEQTDTSLENNERLEFLGDAVLDLAVSHILMETFPHDREGTLSKYRSMIVNESGLSEVAQKLRLGDFLHLGRGEEQSLGRQKSSILANTLEALMGALFIDAGFRTCLEIIRNLFQPFIDKLVSQEMIYDYKSMFQEQTQKAFKKLPQYRLLEEKGPPHDKTFRVALMLDGENVAEGVGKSKKEAEQKAAKEAFHCLTLD
jgi:ribonuclease III